MFGNSTSIRKRVLEVVEAKIKARQEALDAEHKRLDEQCEKDKFNATENAVTEILAKLNL